MSTFDIDKTIAELEAISGDFDTDESTREEANKQIKLQRLKKQDVLFGNIIARTAALQECCGGLEAVIQKAKVGGLGDKIKNLTSMAAQGRSILTELKSGLNGKP